MAPSSVTKNGVNGVHNAKEVSNPSKSASLDASKVNDLLENVDKCLAGGLHGEFFETGSRLDDKNRHGQLEMMFNLQNVLTEVKAQLEKQSRQAEAEQSKANKGAPQANKNVITTIKTVVQQELSDKLRDLSVRNDRLQSDLKQANGKMEALEIKVRTLETQLKKSEGRNQSEQEKRHKVLVGELEAKAKEVTADIAEGLRKLKEAEIEAVNQQWMEGKAGGSTRSDIISIPVLQKCVIRLDNNLESHANRLEHIEGRMACKVSRSYSRIPTPKRTTGVTQTRVFRL